MKVQLVAGVVMLGFLASSGMAAEFDFYGSARVKTFWEWKEAADGKTFADGDTKDVDMDMALQPNSRVGARVKVDDDLSGWAEMGFSESAVTVRHIMGYWNFGEGVLAIGQTDTPVSGRSQLSKRVWGNDGSMKSFGEPDTGRRPQIQLAMHGVVLGFVKPHSNSNILDKDGEESEVDNVMPRIELSYQQKIDVVTVDAFGGFHTYTISTTGKDYDIHSYMAGAGFYFKPGAMYARGAGYYARNARQFGQALSPQPSSFGSAKFRNEELVDNDMFAGTLFGGYKFSDRVSGEIGYGYTQSKDDASGAQTQKWHAYYAQAAFTLRKGMTVTPELGVMEDKETSQKITYAGAKWQVNF